LGGDASDSAWLAIDDAAPMVVGDAPGGAPDTWTWVRLPGTVTLSPGEHDLGLRVRERGVSVDRVVLSTDPDIAPDVAADVPVGN
jgi:hypothetical protein